MIQFQINGGQSEYRKPDQGKQKRCSQSPQHQLTNTATLGNPRNKESHKRRPGNSPGPIEHRPALLPAGSSAGFRPQSHPREVLQVNTETLYSARADEPRATDNPDKQQQKHRQADIEIRQPLDTSG